MILALKEHKTVTLAMPISWAIPGFSPKNLLLSSNIPLGRINNDPHTVFACPYGRTVAHFIRHYKGEINEKTLITEFLPWFYELEENLGFTDAEKKKMSHCLMIAKGDRAWFISRVMDCDEVSGAFSNDYESQASLERTAGMPLVKRIRLAAEDLEQSDGTTAYPLAVIDTKDGKIRLIGKEDEDATGKE